MFTKNKQLQAVCRACGNIQTLDSTHKAGNYLQKSVPKNMSEIDTKKAEENEKEKEDEKLEEQEEDNVTQQQEEGLTIKSEEIRKPLFEQ